MGLRVGMKPQRWPSLLWTPNKPRELHFAVAVLPDDYSVVKLWVSPVVITLLT